MHRDSEQSRRVFILDMHMPLVLRELDLIFELETVSTQRPVNSLRYLIHRAEVNLKVKVTQIRVT